MSDDRTVEAIINDIHQELLSLNRLFDEVLDTLRRLTEE